MAKEDSLLEKGLYFLTALVINLILFTLLSAYLLFARLSYEVNKPITLLLEEIPREEKVIFEKRTQRAGGIKEKLEKDKGGKPVPSLPPVATKSGDVPIAPKETTEESILSEIEKKVKNQKPEITQGKPNVSESLVSSAEWSPEVGWALQKVPREKSYTFLPFQSLGLPNCPPPFRLSSGWSLRVEFLRLRS